jgi:ATP-binding cassette subfamily B multidrug efflux pump
LLSQIDKNLEERKRKMIKKLAKSIKEYKKESILTPIFVSLEVVMEVIIPLLMANLIDKGMYAGNMNEVLKIGLELVGSAMLSLIFGVLSGSVAAKASAGFAKNLRKDLYYKVQDFSFSNIDKFSTASIITRLTTDVTYVQMAFQMIIRIAVRTPLMLVFSLIMAFGINKELSLIFLILIPIVGVALGLISTKVYPIFDRVFKKYDDLNEIVEENVSSIRVVKSYVLEEKEKEKFGKTSNEIYKDFTKAEKIMALNSPIMQFAIYSALILISWFGAKIIVNSHMTALTTGELTSLLTYSIQILSSLMMLTMILVMCTMSKASAQRIVEILDEEPDLKNKKNPIKEVKNGDIEFQNVGFSYIGKKNKEVLKNINLKIKSGETVGIIGGTGDGKSSLINLIPRLYDVSEGKVLVGGVNVKDYNLKALRDQVANVLQKNVLFSGTIKENIRWGDENASDEDVERVCKLAQADEFIRGFDKKYDTYIEQGGTNVSGGQKQRLCIARALLKKPKILILDDSTSAVDTKTDSLIRKAFREEIPNTTKIIIAQRISSVQDADKIVVMDNGRIDAIGTHEELLKNNKIYKEVYESQTKGVEE